MIKKAVILIIILALLVCVIYCTSGLFTMARQAHEDQKAWYDFYDRVDRHISYFEYEKDELEANRDEWEKIAFEFQAETEEWQTKYFQLRDNPEPPYYLK